MTKDAIELLTEDHREVEQLFGRIEGLLSSGGKQLKESVDEATIELVGHSVAEEAYLYPTARSAFPDGDTVADHEIEEHGKVEKLLKELEGMSPDNVEFASTTRRMMEAVRHHVAEEEGELFPRLREFCSAQEIEELGGKLEFAKTTAPTRPHPLAPNKPPLNKLLAPGTGLIDRVRDALTGRGAHH